MILAIASGKGGTGKTSLATALALRAGLPVTYVDCDVEEPNGHLLLKPDNTFTHIVETLVPEIDKELCDGCGTCAKLCEFNALAVVGSSPLVFDELCHSCGLCASACPKKAITEKPRKIGEVMTGTCGNVSLVQGKLDVGVAMSPPVIRAAKKQAKQEHMVILDCPPGTSCPVVEAVKGCDAVILVTEPTTFGLHDLKLAVDLMRILKLPFGVVINRDGSGDDGVEIFCKKENVKILAKIPHDRRIAEAYSNGIPMNEVTEEAASTCREILKTVREGRFFHA